MDEIDRDENTLSSRPAEVNPPVSSETPAGATETSIETFPPQTDAEIVRAELETAAQERIRGRDPISAGEIRIIDAEEEGNRITSLRLYERCGQAYLDTISPSRMSRSSTSFKFGSSARAICLPTPTVSLLPLRLWQTSVISIHQQNSAKHGTTTTWATLHSHTSSQP